VHLHRSSSSSSSNHGHSSLGAEQGQQLEAMANAINPETGRPYYNVQAGQGGNYTVTPDFTESQIPRTGVDTGSQYGVAPVDLQATGLGRAGVVSQPIPFNQQQVQEYGGRRVAGQFDPEQLRGLQMREAARVLGSYGDPARAAQLEAEATRMEREAEERPLRLRNLEQQVKIANENTQREINNAEAAKDSVRIIKGENGKLTYTIKSYEFDIANLRADQKALTDKYVKALSLNKKLEGVNSLLMVDIEVKDSVIASLRSTKIDSVTTRFDFNATDDWQNGNSRKITGFLNVKRGLDNSLTATNPILTLEQRIKLLASIEEKDGIQSVKITTDYPGLSFNDIENINLINNKLNQKPEKKAGWSVGVGVGYGVMLSPSQIVTVGPTIGLNLIWSPKWLRFN
jgi:hypothetical protein